MNHVLALMPLVAPGLTPTLAQAASPAGSAPYRPFLQPMSIHDEGWFTLIPLALLISIAYKAVRVRTVHGFPRSVLMMTVQIVVAMIALALGQHVFVEWIVPALSR